MPLREYLCDACGRKQEVIESHGDPPLTICDRCGQPVRRLLAAPAVQFKGSGWYVSDYGKSGSGDSKKSNGDSASSSSSSEKSSDKSSDKPSEKSSEKPAASSSEGSSSSAGSSTASSDKGEKKA